MNQRVLFISHQAGRSGAPIVLLHLLRWLKQHSTFEFSVLLGQDGELAEEFRQVAETYIWDLPPAATIWRNRWDRATGQMATHHQQQLKRIKQFAPTIIYANTIVAATLGVQLKQAVGCPLLCHVHELEVVIDEFIGTAAFTELSKRIDFFIAASEAVAVNLHQRYQIPRALISTVYEFVPTLEATQFAAARQQIRRQLGFADDTFVIAGAGSIDWRKAPDLFIQVAQHLRVVGGTAAKAIWIGGNLASGDGRKVRHDAKHAGVGEMVRFLGAQTNPYDYLSAADVFLLTSREDPYPLVCLEAAALGIPIICFADAGGMPEFVEQDCGMVVPYLRSDLMAAAVQQIQNQEGLRKILGANAARKMRQRHTIDLAGQQISELIQRVLRS